MKRFLFAVMPLLISSVLNAQIEFNQEKMVPISPNAASLGMYGAIDMSLYTGSANISIPIYELDLDGQKFPISLSYNSSGVKVAQEASWVGLNWSLNVGGCITKEVKGWDDFERGPLGYYWDREFPTPGNVSPLFDQMTNAEKENYLSYTRNWKDPEPDIFYFNMANHSGSMFFKKNNTDGNTDTKAKPVIQKIISPLDITFDVVRRTWVIIDEKGNSYFFATSEESEMVTRSTSSPLTNLTDFRWGPRELQPRLTTAWQLDSIKSPQNNTIKFYYQFEKIYTPLSISESTAVLTSIYGSEELFPDKMSQFFYSYSSVNQALLSKIEFDGGEIVFKLTDRDDIEHVTSGQKAKKLSGISVKNRQGDLIKDVSFTYGYLGEKAGMSSFDKRLLLKSLSEEGLGAVYRFNYTSGVLPEKSSLSTDHWGYYNGSSAPSAYGFQAIPPLFTATREFTGRDKSFNSGQANVGLLSSIQYPTGGETKFEYEPHYLGKMPYEVIKRLGIDMISNEETETYKLLFGVDIVSRPFEITDTTRKITISARHDYPMTNNSPLYYYIYLQKKKGDNYIAVGHYPLRADKSTPSPIDIGAGSLEKGTYRLLLYVEETYGYKEECYIAVDIEATYLTKEYRALEGGGFRIKSIKSILEGGKEEIKTYTYSKATLMTPIQYHFFDEISVSDGASIQPKAGIGTYAFCQSMPYRQFNVPGRNNIIGYDSIKELTSGADGLGSTIYEYHNVPDNIDSHLYVTGAPSTPHLLNGSPSQISIYDSSDSLVKQTKFVYSNHRSDHIWGMKYFMMPSAFIRSTSLTGYQSLISYIQFYETIEEQWKLDQEVTSLYFPNKGRTNERILYGYDSLYLNTTSVKKSHSNGDISEQLTKYPFDYTDIVNKGMVSRGMIGIPIENISLLNNNVVAAKKMEFKDSFGMYLPHKIYSFYSNIPKSLMNYQTLYQTDYTFSRYNSKGRLLEYIQPSGIYTSYVWDSNSLHLIAIVSNSTYNDAIQYLGQYNPNGVTLPISGTEQTIRNKLPNALVTTYTHKPLVGMLTATDPRGITTYYYYDAFGRLTETYIIEAGVKKIVQAYDYHYKQ